MMQVPMKHALSKAYEEWKSGAEVVEPAPAPPVSLGHLQEEGCANKITSEKAGAWFWAASILALTVVEVTEAFYNDSAFIDLLQVILFLNSFLVILGHLYLNRKGICRNMDVLIDWSSDGLARKKLMVRQSFYAVIIVSGQYWGHLCAYHL